MIMLSEIPEPKIITVNSPENRHLPLTVNGRDFSVYRLKVL